MSNNPTRPLPAGPHDAAVRVRRTAAGGRVGAAPSGHPSACSCELETVSGPAGPIMVLRVAGEVDVLTVAVLEHALTAAVDQQPGDLVVDLAAVLFCCVRGFALLATTATTAQRNGTDYAVSGMSPHLDRIATSLWPEQRYVRYRSAAVAVTSIRIDQTYRPG